MDETRTLKIKDKELIFRLLEVGDYHKGYLKLLNQLSKTPEVLFEQFQKQFKQMSQTNENLQYKVLVIEDTQTNIIIATGTLFIENYLFNQVGHIEGIVTDEKYRGLGLAQIIIKKLIDLAKTNGLSQVILYCEENNKAFYQKLNFQDNGQLLQFYL